MKNFFTILGGMGTMATESFARLLNHRTIAKKDQDYLNYILVNHATIPDRTAYILDNDLTNPIPALIEDIKQQSLLEPNFFVLTCNTAHYFFDTLQDATTIPILHMPREAVMSLSEKYPVASFKKVAFLGTEGSVQAGVYEQELRNMNYEPVIPNKEIQTKINDLIYRDIKENNYLNEKLFLEILADLLGNTDCSVAILGCTELSLMQERVQNNPFHVIDAQSILVDKTIKLALKERQNQE
ncbi:amino acid racemase [Enterococcus rivorum]|uniref:Aspartate racemase n=1 Tax=Enterococcus rivorum TaxID=762845 RepID=A0A1E5KUM5_9ENTE|nr:amino acid racemase [Enterococcus rivorum]MBP2100594.1 aspartate racemase [Enterococcus rivorum]OEH81574.1 aspartate racemase [Enterococcus rivorum]